MVRISRKFIFIYVSKSKEQKLYKNSFKTVDEYLELLEKMKNQDELQF